MIIPKLHFFVLILANSYPASGKTYNDTLTCPEGWVDGSSVNMGDLTKHLIQPIIISVLTNMCFTTFLFSATIHKNVVSVRSRWIGGLPKCSVDMSTTLLW